MPRVNRFSAFALLAAVAFVGFALSVNYLYQRNAKLKRSVVATKKELHETKQALDVVTARVDRIAANELAKELAEASRPKLVFIHAILRPDANGKWFVQNDVDHASQGMHQDRVTQLVQDEKSLRIYFDKRYAKAGVIQITTDDGFAGAIVANASLGLEAAEIQLRALPNVSPSARPINPRNILKYMPNKGNGNLWISVTMIDDPKPTAPIEIGTPHG